jgi:hypothetical protein
LAAAVRYVKNNTPKLVSDEICNALNHIPDTKEMVGDLLVEYDMENSAFAKDLRAVLAPQQRTWVGLTDEEFDDIIAYANPHCDELAFAQAIEAKLKEKNT